MATLSSLPLIFILLQEYAKGMYTPALNAVTPLLVPAEQLAKCAGYSQSTSITVGFVKIPKLKVEEKSLNPNCLLYYS